jgi:hypothetical protein
VSAGDGGRQEQLRRERGAVGEEERAVKYTGEREGSESTRKRRRVGVDMR